MIPELACDIANYLYKSPEMIHPYLKCLGRVRPYLSNPSQAFEIFEDRVTNLINLITTTIKRAKSHQNETIKFAKQVSNVSNIAELQEVLEKIVVKSRKLDILPAPIASLLSVISIPSSPV